MANLIEAETFDAGVYQIETTDAVVGGADGTSNKAAKNLANRTKWLKARVDEMAAVVTGFLTAADLTGFWGDFNADLLDGYHASEIMTLPGTIIFHAKNTPPAGYLKANGAAVSRATYADLFAEIGTTFGSGDGVNTFNLPDLRGVFVRGWDDGRGYDSGRAFGSYQADEFKSHTHLSYSSPGTGQGYTGVNSVQQSAGSEATSTTGGSETRPKNVALLACIKY
jgi:microcystin-dependent protein